MWPVFTEKQALKKEARIVLEGAQKVLLYRGDVIFEEAYLKIENLIGVLQDQLASKPFDSEKVSAATENLNQIITQHGGKIYPVTFRSDIVEMVVMAAIIAGGIRSFVFQPFKIPTNSMWPTYNGMTSVVRAPAAPAPSFPEKVWHKITDWSTTYIVPAQASGMIMIPLESSGQEGGVKQYRLRQRTSATDFQEIYIGDYAQAIGVPQDFNLDGVILRTFYPEYAEMPLRRQDHDRWQKIINQGVADNLIEKINGVPMLKTRRMVQAGETLLNFDILTGDMLFVDRISYNFVNPSRGDTFVFRTNHIPGLADRFGVPSQNYYVKRIAGIPGDKLRINFDGQLFVNQSVVTSPEPMVLNSQRATSRNYYGYIADIGNYPYSIPLTNEYEVTAEHYYALGDNSANSYDSRGWGEVPGYDVVGRPLVILHPFSARWGWAK